MNGKRIFTTGIAIALAGLTSSARANEKPVSVELSAGGGVSGFIEGASDLTQVGGQWDVRARLRTPILLGFEIGYVGTANGVTGLLEQNAHDGIIVGNTTVARPANLRDRAHAAEAGGLSGRPLFRRATRMLAEAFVRVEGQFPLVGTGGVDSGAAAFTKIKAGATLIQLYTGLVFRGVHLVTDIKADLVSFLRLGRHDSLAAAIGLDAVAMTAEPWPE